MILSKVTPLLLKLNHWMIKEFSNLSFTNQLASKNGQFSALKRTLRMPSIFKTSSTIFLSSTILTSLLTSLILSHSIISHLSKISKRLSTHTSKSMFKQIHQEKEKRKILRKLRKNKATKSNFSWSLYLLVWSKSISTLPWRTKSIQTTLSSLNSWLARQLNRTKKESSSTS